MKLLYAGCLHKGPMRSVNEDAYLMRVKDQAGLFLVADGIGGRDHGEVVSGMIRDRYDQWWQERILPQGKSLGFSSAISELKNVLVAINREVVQQFGELTAGSTIALLFIQEGKCIYLSSGDSRVYRARGLSFQQLTVDDVYENNCERSTEFNEASKGKLISAVGIRLNPEFSVRTGSLQAGDRFFLCSDGVYRYVSLKKLRKKILFGAGSPNKLIDNILQIVEDNGAGDNYSMVYVKVSAR